MTFLIRYWKELVVAVAVAGVILYVQGLRIENARLNLKIAKIEATGAALADEYAKNIVKFEKKRVVTEVVYRDKIKYIKEDLDENASCDMAMDAINRYQF